MTEHILISIILGNILMSQSLKDGQGRYDIKRKYMFLAAKIRIHACICVAKYQAGLLAVTQLSQVSLFKLKRLPPSSLSLSAAKLILGESPSSVRPRPSLVFPSLSLSLPSSFSSLARVVCVLCVVCPSSPLQFLPLHTSGNWSLF